MNKNEFKDHIGKILEADTPEKQDKEINMLWKLVNEKPEKKSKPYGNFFRNL